MMASPVGPDQRSGFGVRVNEPAGEAKRLRVAVAVLETALATGVGLGHGATRRQTPNGVASDAATKRRATLGTGHGAVGVVRPPALFGRSRKITGAPA